MKTNRPPRMGPDMRKFFGCIATVERDGEHHSQRFADVDAVIAYCDEYSAVVVSISTPDTILRDLDGSRADITYRPTARSGSGQPADRIQFPEEKMLAAKHRLELWVGGR